MALPTYDEYFAYATQRGNTPLTPEAIQRSINEAVDRGVSMSRIEEFLAGDGFMDVQRLWNLEPDLNRAEVQAGVIVQTGTGQWVDTRTGETSAPVPLAYTGAGNAFQGIAGQPSAYAESVAPTPTPDKPVPVPPAEVGHVATLGVGVIPPTVGHGPAGPTPIAGLSIVPGPGPGLPAASGSGINWLYVAAIAIGGYLLWRTAK